MASRPENASARKTHRLVAVTLDENSIGRSGPDVEHERAVAIYDLLEANTFVLLPSAVCKFSWNVIFNPTRAAGKYRLREQHRFSLDTRLNPPR